MKSVIVKTSARLHLGFYNFLNENTAYGSIGIAIEEPHILIKVSKADKFRVINETTIPIDDVVNNVISKLSINPEELKMELRCENAYPRHTGLGSTTQLNLAIGMAILRFLDKSMSVQELAVKLGRGRDSGIGIAAFQYGGFIVDSGRKISEQGIVEPPSTVDDLPKPIFKSKVPGNWYFILFIPRKYKGLDEKSERKVLDRPEPPPKDFQRELYELMLLKLIPSVLFRDIELFGKTLTKMQIMVGTYFSKYQGGVFCCDETEFTINSLLKHGAYGAGQSSWGPTAYGIARGFRMAMRVMSNVKRDIERRDYDADVVVTKVKNKGAYILKTGE